MRRDPTRNGRRPSWSARSFSGPAAGSTAAVARV